MVNSRVLREVYKKSYLTRGIHRVSRRSISDSVKLGVIAKELVEYYLTIDTWSGFDRVLRVAINAEDQQH